MLLSIGIWLEVKDDGILVWATWEWEETRVACFKLLSMTHRQTFGKVTARNPDCKPMLFPGAVFASADGYGSTYSGDHMYCEIFCRWLYLAPPDTPSLCHSSFLLDNIGYDRHTEVSPIWEFVCLGHECVGIVTGNPWVPRTQLMPVPVGTCTRVKRVRFLAGVGSGLYLLLIRSLETKKGKSWKVLLKFPDVLVVILLI